MLARKNLNKRRASTVASLKQRPIVAPLSRRIARVDSQPRFVLFVTVAGIAFRGKDRLDLRLKIDSVLCPNLLVKKQQEYPENLYYYDPYDVEGDPAATEKNLAQLSQPERAKYQKWKDTLLFNDVYFNFTGRSYLANYLRDPPRHFMVSIATVQGWKCQI